MQDLMDKQDAKQRDIPAASTSVLVALSVLSGLICGIVLATLCHDMKLNHAVLEQPQRPALTASGPKPPVPVTR